MKLSNLLCGLAVLGFVGIAQANQPATTAPSDHSATAPTTHDKKEETTTTTTTTSKETTPTTTKKSKTTSDVHKEEHKVPAGE